MALTKMLRILVLVERKEKMAVVISPCRSWLLASVYEVVTGVRSAWLMQCCSVMVKVQG